MIRGGISKLFAALEIAELERFCAETLGPLAAQDLRMGGTLVETLEIYSTCGSATETARQLRTHRNTVRYRLQRAEELLGADLNDPDARLRVAVALRGHRVLALRRAAEFVQSAQRRTA